MTSHAVPWKVRRARLLTVIREQGEALLRVNLTGMSRQDASRWASARTMADLGEMVIAWLNGEITQTPGHCGPPERETIPLIPALTVINRGGFITDCSQLAESMDGETWNTWLDGFTSDAVLLKMRAAVDGTPLVLTACRGSYHECSQAAHLARCLGKEVPGFWADACPAIADELRDCWYVSVEDPEPGRNDLLWPTLAAALRQ